MDPAEPAWQSAQAVAGADGVTTYFDISTSARWSGHPVGIVRVERELAGRGGALLGGTFGHCVYDLNQNVFHDVSRDDAQAILTGRLQIDFSGAPAAPALPTKQTLMRSARTVVLKSPWLYQQVQRVRGRSFSIEQIEQIKASEEAAARIEAERAVEVRPLEQVSTGVIPLSRSTTIISGGLDWEHKKTRALYDLKQTFGFRYVAIIYDMIPLFYPHYVVPAYVDLLADYFGELLWLADRCLCISQATQRDLIEHCRVNSYPLPSSDHFPLGSDLPQAIGGGEIDFPAALEGKRYGIFVSTVETRKNHRTLYQAWDYALRRGWLDPERDRLLFVGRMGWNTSELMHEVAANPRTQETILHLQHVSDATLRALYQRATVGLFPSHYEGYGLPLAELLRYGKACISSDAGSLPEVGGDLVRYVDAVDVVGWAKAMGELFSNPSAVGEIERRVKETYDPISWDQAARLFFERLGEMRAAA